jgi:hypothetical protein
MPLFCFFILFGDCFLFYSILCLYVNVWSIEYKLFEEYVVTEGPEDFQQHQVLVEEKSLLHSHLPITTCISITLFIYLFLCIKLKGLTI